MSQGQPGRSSFPALDALLLLILLNLALQPLVEPDFGWHLRTGLDLLNNGWRLPGTDPYSHTMSDWPWVEHAWLTDGLIGLLYTDLGPAGGLGVILFFAAVTVGAFGAAAGLARAGRTHKLLAVTGVAWVALPFLGARTQLVTLLGLAVLLRLCTQYASVHRRPLWPLLPLFLVWANLHGGFTAGLFVLALLLVTWASLRLISEWQSSGWGRRLANRIDEPVPSWTQLRHLVLVAGLAAAVTLVNPYGWRLHAEIYSSLTDRFMIQTLREWQPVSLSSRAGVYYAGYLIVLGLMVLLRYRRVEPTRWVILAVFLALSLRHWRNVLFFLLLSIPLGAELLAALSSQLTARVAILDRYRKPWLLAGSLALGAWMAVLGAEHLQRVVQCGLAPVEFFRGTEYPIEAVQWVRAHRARVGTRLFNEYGHGGFLLWWLPDEKIFIDGRMPAWKVGDRWIFHDAVALTAWNPPALAMLQKYGVDWAIVERDRPLDRALKNQAIWTEVYRDAKVTIYVKNQATVNAAA